MSKAYILRNGQVVELPEPNFTNLIFDMSGFLSGFDITSNNVTRTFKYFLGVAYDQGIKKNILKEGFYEPLEYEIFVVQWLDVSYLIKVPSPDYLYSNHFISNESLILKYPINPESIITARFPGSEIHDSILYSQTIKFKPPLNSSGTNILPYNYEQGKVSFPLPPVTSFYNEQFAHYPWNELNQGILKNKCHLFFLKNFIEPRQQSILGNDSLIVITSNSITVKTCLAIENICRNILLEILPFSNITPDQLPHVLHIGKNSNWTQAGFQQEYYYLYEIVYSLFRSWAFYVDSNPSENYEPIFNVVGEIELRQDYLNTVREFQNIWLFNSSFIKKAEVNEKIALLFSLSTPKSLRLIDASLRLKILENLLKGNWKIIEESFWSTTYDKKVTPIIELSKNGKALANLIQSFEAADANDLLSLLDKKIQVGQHLKYFQVLYEKLKDSQNYLWSEMTEKGNAMVHLMYLWMVSDYNPLFAELFSNDTEPENLDGNKVPVIINYSSKKTSPFYFNYKSFDFENGKIREKAELIPRPVAQFLDLIPPPPLLGLPNYNLLSLGLVFNEKKEALLDIFQPITLVDFQPDNHAIKVQMINLAVFGFPPEHSQSALLPAFFLKYMDDFADKETFWNLISVTVDIVLTFTGLSGLSILKNMRHVGKLGKLFRLNNVGGASAAALQQLGTIAKIRYGFTIFEFSASFCHLLLQYTTASCGNFKNEQTQWINAQWSQQSNQQDKVITGLPENEDVNQNSPESERLYELCRALDDILQILSLVGFVGDLSLGIAMSKRLKKIKNEGFIPESYVNPSHANFNIHLYQIKNEIDLFNTAIDGIYSHFVDLLPNGQSKTTLLNYLQSSQFTEIKRMHFIEDMQPLLKQFNNKYDDLLEFIVSNKHNWNSLYENGLTIQRQSKNILSNSFHVLGYINAKDYSVAFERLMKYSEAKQLDFIKTIGGHLTPAQWAKFNGSDDLFKGWFKYFDDLELKPMFMDMGVDNMVLWCDHYGVLPLNLINELKSKPLAFKNWKNLDEADRLLLKNIPHEWIPSVYQYQDFCFIRKFCPLEIPHFAEILPDLNKSGYLQFRFKWTDNNGFTITARVHQPIPGSNYFDDGQVWIINRKKPVNPGEIKIEHIYLNDGTWFRFEDNANLLGSDNWKGLINRQKKIPPIITPPEQEILAKGHFKAK